MKRWTKIAVIAVAAIAMTAAPAMAGHRVRVRHQHGGHGIGWTHSYHGVSSYVPRVPVYHPPVYHPPIYHPPVYHQPVYVPRHRQSPHHHWGSSHRIHSNSGIGIHTQGFGLHIRF